MSSRPVRRRHVFYIPGYDPIHPRRYRELYRKEGAAQAAISGYDITLSPQQVPGRFGWQVEATIDGISTVTNFETLIWSDIVRGSMDHGIASSYGQMLRTAWIYISTGVLFRMMRLRKGPVIAALYPVGFMLLQLFLAVVLGSVIVWAGKAALIPYLGLAGHLIALAAGGASAYGLLVWIKRHDNRFYIYYLMHNYAYSAQHHGANPPELRGAHGRIHRRGRAGPGR